MNTTKISIKIYEPLLSAFDSQLDRVFFKRDAFLNNILKTEIKKLDKEMEGKRLSREARRYISQELRRLGTKNINIVVEKDVADFLNEIIDRHNMVRDAFMNRLFLFLRSSDKLLSYLDIPPTIDDPDLRHCESMPTSPLYAIESVISDPFFYIENAVRKQYNTGIYLLELPPERIGFSCFLDDSQVPGTKEFNSTYDSFE
ncbi:hypothetical protein [Methylomonas sp. AM2-LC]|jgi:hypothetical protein|uniref:hypothetical protein n=1 Tax=Methylomonas sp. AM2-LC TaxID=3153301 RepID=UPI0032666EED